MHERAPQVGLVELEEDHVALALLGHDQLDGRVQRVLSPRGRDLGDAAALRVRAGGRVGHHDVRPVEAAEQRLAAPGQLAADALARARVREALQHRVDAALQHPVGQQRAQRGAGGGVGVDVAHHVLALGARGVDQGEGVGDLAPARPARGLHVAHLGGQSALAADADGLRHRVEQRRPLAADVARVEAAPARGAAGDADDLLGGRVGAGGVDQAGGEAVRAVGHRLVHHALHVRLLGRGGRAAREAHGGQAQRAVADELRHVERDALPLVAREVLADRLPREVHARGQVEGEALHLGAELIRDRGGGEAAVADHLGGDALADLRLGAPVVPEAPVGVRVHVDEAGGDGAPARVDGAPGRLAGKIADRGDGVAGHSHVGTAGGCAGAVDELPARDLEVEHGSRA